MRALFRCTLTLSLAVTSLPLAALTLDEAEVLALQSDPMVNSYIATSRSHQEESVANRALPDPRLILGAVNVPVDSFDLSREPMTQLKLGVKQDFPRGSSRELRQQVSSWLSRAALAAADDSRRQLVRDVRQAYLNLYYETAALNVIRESMTFFNKLVTITESNYAAGRSNQQDVILANLELSRLEDRITRIRAMEEGYRTELAVWIGDRAWEPIDSTFPSLPELPVGTDLNAIISEHPVIRSQDARIKASRSDTEVARQDYKPGWSASLDYGFRSGTNSDGSSRGDFATALVSLDIPLFTENRQDRKVAARQEKTTAEQYRKDDKLRRLRQQYEKDRHLWQRLGERADLYRNSLLASAKSNTRASLTAYQSGVSEFDTLMRARITELDVRLEDLRIRVDRALAQARLLYITGDYPR